MYKGAHRTVLIMFYVVILLLASALAVPVISQPPTQINRPGTRPAYIHPLIPQCFYEGNWYPTGAIIKAGRSGDWCYGAFCDKDGRAKFWNNYNCPEPNRQNPKPVIPNSLPNIPEQRWRTSATVIQRPPTTSAPPPPTPLPYRPAPTTSPPPQPITAPYHHFQTTQPFNNVHGCFYRGRFYWAGQDIYNRRRGHMCLGSYCDFNSQIQVWQDRCAATISPFDAS